MPGIAGIIKKGSNEQSQRDLHLMVESMRHETFYVGDQFANADAGVYVGWTSHPGSLAQAMPLISADKQRVLILFGETFSHTPDFSSSNSGGLEASARGLLKLYEESGEKFLRKLNGWFCGVVIDLSLGNATLFNDRYGMSRVYFHEGEDEFLFASEAKSLLRLRPNLRAIEPDAMAQFMRFNCVMGNRSLFKGISLLPPASLWLFNGSSVPKKEYYFDYADWEQQPILPAEEFHEKFESTVSKVVPAYFGGPQQAAISLTSGLDTRVILSCAMEQKRRLPCYTFGGMWGETFDIQAARKLAALSHLSHEVIRINEGFLQEFPSYARKSIYVSDGTHDVLGAHDVYFNEVARKIAPIRVTGKFGSEVVRTRKLIPSGNFPRELLQPSFAHFLDEVPAFSRITQRTHPLTRAVSEEIPWYEHGRVSVEQSQIVLRTPFMDNELVKLMYQALPELRASRDLQARYVKTRSTELAGLRTNLGSIVYGNWFTSKAAYFPLWALFKLEYIYLYATPHWLTWVDRKMEKLRLERFVAGRQKFEYYRIWIKTHLAEFVRDTLLSSQTRCTEYFDKASVEQVVTRHLAGTHNYLIEINKMLTVELICSTLLA